MCHRMNTTSSASSDSSIGRTYEQMEADKSVYASEALTAETLKALAEAAKVGYASVFEKGEIHIPAARGKKKETACA